jgi:hypothetical protein
MTDLTNEEFVTLARTRGLFIEPTKVDELAAAYRALAHMIARTRDAASLDVEPATLFQAQPVATETNE